VACDDPAGPIHPGNMIPFQGLPGAIGYTPLVELGRVRSANGARIPAMLEGGNPGGSVKDRPARSVRQRTRRLLDLSKWIVLR